MGPRASALHSYDTFYLTRTLFLGILFLVAVTAGSCVKEAEPTNFPGGCSRPVEGFSVKGVVRYRSTTRVIARESCSTSAARSPLFQSKWPMTAFVSLIFASSGCG